MRDYIRLGVNGKVREIRGADCFLTLSEYLRRRLGMVGTKIVCSEGDCGSCTVLVGRTTGDRTEYRPVDSCIQFIFQLDGAHIVTVEGLRQNGSLSPVQSSLVECHGSQCGFCTPGFAVAMTGLLEEHNGLSEADMREGLTGNLCRCTGYVPILESGIQASLETHRQLNEIYPPSGLFAELKDGAGEGVKIEDSGSSGRKVCCPATLNDALEFLAAHPKAKVVAGATDVGVQWNKGQIAPKSILDLNQVTELLGTEVASGIVDLGARVTWSELREVCRDSIPELDSIIEVFGAPQIRHVGTIGGNIVNASPIADSLPFLFVMEAELELQSTTGKRSVNITEFYQGYKQLDLRAGELLTRIRFPLPTDDQRLRLYKVSRRRDLDISTFTAGLLLDIEAERIREARIALGAVGPAVIRARATEEFLQDRSFSEETMTKAGEVALGEISPITDVRGSREYRNQLTKNVFLKFYHQEQSEKVQHV